MFITWTPSFHSDRHYYEIRYSTDPELKIEKWDILDDKLPVSHGEWFNHHGEMRFTQLIYEGGQSAQEIEYTHCLPAREEFYYRVRTLNQAFEPIDEWSDSVVGTVEDYIKGRKRVIPSMKF